MLSQPRQRFEDVNFPKQITVFKSSQHTEFAASPCWRLYTFSSKYDHTVNNIQLVHAPAWVLYDIKQININNHLDKCNESLVQSNPCATLVPTL